MELRRPIHPDTKAALQGVFNAIVMVRVDWPGDTVRAHSGVGTLQWDGQEWGGVGDFGGISIPPEMGGLAQQPGRLRIVGLDETLFGYIDAADDARDQGVDIYFAAVTERAGNEIIGEPITASIGYIDALDMIEEADGADVTLGVELEFRSGPSARSAASAHHNDASQRQEFPDDTAGRLVGAAQANSTSITWPN